jgi:hypothetical protein
MSPTEIRLEILRSGGVPVDELSAEQRAVLIELSDQEVELLLDVKRRLDAIEPEVHPHGSTAGPALF